MTEFLTREEMLAVIGAPGADWMGQRDKLLLALLYNTGARVSEAIGVKVGDVVLAPAACVHLHGRTQAAVGAALAIDGQGDPRTAEVQRT